MLPDYFARSFQQGIGPFSKLPIPTILVWIIERLYEKVGP